MWKSIILHVTKIESKNLNEWQIHAIKLYAINKVMWAVFIGIEDYLLIIYKKENHLI